MYIICYIYKLLLYDRFINYFVPAGSHTHRTGMCRNFKFCSFYVPLDCSVDVISILSERATYGCGIRLLSNRLNFYRARDSRIRNSAAQSESFHLLKQACLHHNLRF